MWMYVGRECKVHDLHAVEGGVVVLRSSGAVLQNGPARQGSLEIGTDELQHQEVAIFSQLEYRAPSLDNGGRAGKSDLWR